MLFCTLLISPSSPFTLYEKHVKLHNGTMMPKQIIRTNNNNLRRSLEWEWPDKDASETPNEYVPMWIGWSAISGFVGLFCIIVVLGILCGPKEVRRRSFNQYLIAIMVPDIIFSVMCSITCGLNAAAGKYYSEHMCAFQAFYCQFAFTANSWMNGVIAWQIHTMLKKSHAGNRYNPPPTRTVLLHTALVYTYSAFISSISFFGLDWLPHGHSTLDHGLACLMFDRSEPSHVLFFWLAYFPLFMGIPIGYAAWVFFDVWRRNLLPNTGRQRELAIYFTRIIVVFLVMWTPSVILIYIVGFSSHWVGYWGGTWSHFQPLVSACFSLMKTDIKCAVVSFVTCGRYKLSPRPQSSSVHYSSSVPRRRGITSSFRIPQGFWKGSQKGHIREQEEEDVSAEGAAINYTSSLVSPLSNMAPPHNGESNNDGTEEMMDQSQETT